MTREINAIITIAFRDITKLFRDRIRLVSGLVFPVIFIGVLGGSLQSSLGEAVGFSFIVFVFTGVLAQTMFQSSASGVLFLLEDRENDFSQEMFVAPVSPRSIILGKIIGESFVALTQGVGIVAFGLLVGVPLTLLQLLLLVPVAFIACLLGGAFGILLLANLSSQRTVRQIFPFLIFPQLFLSGVFTPLKDLPPILDVLSKIAPMTYVVDFTRGIYYAGQPEFDLVVAANPLYNIIIIGMLFLVFLVVGTALFVRRERNR
jgi:ABC-2 type transport system permease protein